MSASFSLAFVEDLVARSLAALPFTELTGEGGGPLLPLKTVGDAPVDAGFVRVWRGPAAGPVDRMIHFRLVGGPVDTQLFFLHGKPETAMPHLHLQVVQFAPESCVYNADFLPRLDPVDYPAYWTRVFAPLNTAYWKATNNYDNVCSHAPGNPAIAAYLSPWSIACSRPATKAELERVTPSLHAYLAHWLALAAEGFHFDGPPGAALRARDEKHIACFMDESLDPRAWKGVYRAVGEETGRRIRAVLARPCY